MEKSVLLPGRQPLQRTSKSHYWSGSREQMVTNFIRRSSTLYTRRHNGRSHWHRYQHRSSWFYAVKIKIPTDSQRPDWASFSFSTSWIRETQFLTCVGAAQRCIEGHRWCMLLFWKVNARILRRTIARCCDLAIAEKRQVVAIASFNTHQYYEKVTLTCSVINMKEQDGISIMSNSYM